MSQEYKQQCNICGAYLADDGSCKFPGNSTHVMFGMQDRIAALEAQLAEKKAEEGDWYVTNHEQGDAPLRGPFKHSETAGFVRNEMEHTAHYSNVNLWILQLKEESAALAPTAEREA